MNEKPAQTVDALRRQAVARLQANEKPAAARPAAEADTARLAYELEVLQSELQIQNEELAQSRVRLEAAQKQHADLCEATSAGYFTLERDGAISEVNLSGARLLDLEQAQLVGQPFEIFVSAAFRPAFHDFLSQVFTVPGKHSCDMALREAQNELRWVRIDAASADGQACRAILQDITERKRSEVTLGRRVSELEALYSASVALRTAQTSNEVLPILLDAALSALESDAGGIALYHPEQDELRAAVARGFGRDFETVSLKPNQGMFGQVFSSGQTYISSDIANDPHTVLPAGQQLPKGWGGAGVFIRAGATAAGVLFIPVPPGRSITTEQVKLLEALAEICGAALHRMRLHEEATGQLGRILEDNIRRLQTGESLRQRVAELEALHSVSITLRSAQTRNEALPILLDEALAAVESDSGQICLYDPAQDLLRVAFARGFIRVFDKTTVKPGDGIVGKVFTDGQTYISTEFASDPLVDPSSVRLLPAHWGGAGVPIRTGATTVGVIMVALPSERPITVEQVKLLESLAEMGGAALHRMSLYEETARQVERLQVLHNIDLTIGASMNLPMTLTILLQHVKTQLQVDAADVLLLSPSLNTLDYAAGTGFRTRSAQSFHIRLGQSFAGRAALERRAVQADDLSPILENAQFAALWAGEQFAAYYGVPLIAKGEVKGVLEVYRRSAFHPEPDWTDFLETLAGQAAIAIDNALLFENLQRSNLGLALAYDATIEGWSHALDLRDKETEGHTLRVTELTERLARAMGIGDEEQIHIRRGSLLHDIGKMGVPDAILLKAGPLTADEWVVMRKHPQYAYEMLSPIAYLHPALDIPYCHHEKWDGTGYPRGLTGEQIPLAARIFAVCDVWDALCSDRPYRTAWPPDKVRDHIRSLAGTHFDPTIVESFFALL